MLSLMELLEAHEHLVHYPLHDVRGAADRETWKLSEHELRLRLEHGEPITFDCSQCYTQLCRWAGLRDPSGLKYAYPGNTGTILHHASLHDGIYRDPKLAGLGAGCVFGPQGGEHMSAVKVPGHDPTMFSHGRPGIDVLKLSVERQAHDPPVRFCSIRHL